MLEVTGTDESVETGTSGELTAAGKGYSLSPYGDEAVRRAEETCSSDRTVASSSGEWGAGAE